MAYGGDLTHLDRAALVVLVKALRAEIEIASVAATESIRTIAALEATIAALTTRLAN